MNYYFYYYSLIAKIETKMRVIVLDSGLFGLFFINK